MAYLLEKTPSWIKVAVEFRHPSWQRDEVFRLLEERGATYCVMSGANLPCVLRATAPFVYVPAEDSPVHAVTPSGSVTPLIPPPGINSSPQSTSLTVAPDNTADNASANSYFFLYACDTAASTIVRLRLSTANPGAQPNASDVVTAYGSVSPLSAPVCGRVASNGDLYVSSGTSGSGVYLISGVSTASSGPFSAPAQVFGSSAGPNFTGGGISQKNNGDMLVVDNHEGAILRAPFVGANTPPNPPFGSTLSPYVSNLSSPSAIARISTGDFFVANQGTAQVLRFSPTNLSSPTTCSVNVPNGNVTLSSVAASEDNFVYVGIASTSQNKRVVQILNGRAANCGSVGSISLSAVSASSVAAVAVPPVPESPVTTSSNPDKSTGVTSSTFNFGSSIVQTLTDGCTPTLSQSQVPLSYLNGLLPGSNGTTWLGGVPIPSNGEGGFGTLYTVQSECAPTGADNDFILGSYDDTTQFTNPRIIRCDSGTSCTAIDTSGSWPVGGLLPDDTTIGGKVPGFSRFFLANSSLTNSETGAFCGFGSPLTYGTVPFASFNSGQNLSVKFKLGAAGTASCNNGPYITDAIALLSVAQVPNTQGTGILTPVTITSSGNSSSTEPIFSYSPNNQQYQFSLSLKGYTPGTYALIVTFLSNTTVTTLAAPNGGATYVVTYFQVP